MLDLGEALAEDIGQRFCGEEDTALIARACQGDTDAMDQLYRQHRNQIYTLCLNLCGNREEAQDYLQETFVRAFRKLSQFAGRSKLNTWLYRIAVNLVKETARRNCKATQAEVPASAAASSCPDVDTTERVRAVLANMIPSYRLVLALRFSQGLSYQEIAECLGWSLARVKVTLHRAKRSFKNAYARSGDT